MHNGPNRCTYDRRGFVLQAVPNRLGQRRIWITSAANVIKMVRCDRCYTVVRISREIIKRIKRRITPRRILRSSDLVYMVRGARRTI